MYVFLTSSLISKPISVYLLDCCDRFLLSGWLIEFAVDTHAHGELSDKHILLLCLKFGCFALIYYY